MAVINKKLIRFKKLSDFLTRLAANEILTTSIVFIEDAKRIWTQGNYYYCPETIEWSKITNKPTDLASLGITDVYTKDESDDLYLKIGGTAVAALKLSSAKTISLTGAVTGSVSFDGSKSVSINTSVNHTHSQYANQNAFSVINVGEDSVTANAVQDSVSMVAGNNVTLGVSGDEITISAKDTTYGAATTSSAGLMSADDKAKLDGIAAGALKNTVTGVKGSSESSYRTGNVNITKANIGLGNVTNESKTTMFTNAALTGTPTAPTAAANTNTTQIATTAFVQSELASKIAAAEAMRFRGTLGTGGTITELPASHAVGDTYKVITAGTYASKVCEIGDMIICTTTGTSANDAHWTVVQSNIDGAVTGPSSSVNNRVAVFNGTTGKLIKDSGYTIAKSVPSDAKFTDTTYTTATTGKAGLMSADDKSKLDGIDEGANAYVHPTHTAKESGLYKITVNGLGHVSGATAVAKSDITALGIPASNTTYTFSGGTNKFTVTPSGGTALEVTVTPSISKNVTYTGTLTDELVAVFEGTSGQVKASGFTIGKSVPSNAVFTDTIPSAYCSTAAGTAAKTASCSGYVLTANTYLHLIVTSSNSSASALTLNVNGKGTKAIYINGSASSSSNYTLPAGSYIVYYDGTQYQLRTDGILPGKILSAKNADTVNGLSVNTAVPSGAKFTDTTYTANNGVTLSGTTFSHSDTSTLSGSYGPEGNVTGDNGNTIVVPEITVDGFGHVTGVNERVYTSKNTTYSDVTTSTHGLMTAADKTKLNYTNIAYGTCSTAAATAAKVITISGNTNWTLTAGSIIVVKFANTNSALNPTFNVNSTGAKNVWYNTSVLTTSSLGYAGTANRPMEFMYDGTLFVFIGWSLDNNTTYSQASLGQGYGTCATEEATTAKVVTLSSYSLSTGGIVSVKFTYAVPANATMNINSKGAKSIYYKGAAITAGIIPAGAIATFIYSGQYHLIAVDTPSVGTGLSLNGRTINHSNSVTAKTAYGSTATTASANGGTIVVTDIKYDAQGHVTGSTDRTITLSEPHKGTVTSVTLTQGTGITVGNSGTAITSSGSRTISLNTAKTDTIGGVKIAKDNSSYTVATNTSSISANVTSGKYYGVELDKNDKAFVYVPWSNTTYSAGTGLSLSSNTFSLAAVDGLEAASAGPTEDVSGTNNTTIEVPRITIDEYGRVTALTSYTLTNKYRTYSNASTTAAGLMSASDKTKLDGIASGAEVNQNAFAKVTVGSTTITADAKLDTLTIVAGSNVTLTPDATNDKLTIAATDTTYSAITADELNTGTSTSKRTVTAAILAPWVKSLIDSKIAVADAMIYKGTIGSSGATVTALPSTTAKTGWTYKVITAGTYASIKCEVGDMIICLTDGSNSADATWTVVQNNIDGAVTGPASSTDARVAVFNGTTGKVIKDSGFTIGKSVPSNAVFTDTNTKVTSVGNHYTPSANSDSAISVDASSSTAATWGSTSLVTGVNLLRDAAGHVTGMTVDSIKMPSNPNTTYTFAGGTNKFTVTPSGGDALSVTITPSISNNVTYSGTLTSGQVAVYDGTAGKIKSSGYTIAKSVPSGAVFTDTTYTFAGGTGGFTVTPAGGEAQTVSIGKPSTAGTADKAAQLSTARAIDGVNFNGTAAITHYGTCSTAADTAAKTVALTGYTLVTGSRIAVKFTVTNTAANPTLNVNSTGAKAIMYRGSAISAGYLAANRVYEFIYDGTDYELVGDINTDANTQYSAGNGLTLSSTTFNVGAGTGISVAADAVSLAESGVTAGTYGDDEATRTLTHSDVFDVPQITIDKYGRVTSASTKTLTLPASGNTDTKVNVTLATTTKAYLLGVSTAPTSTAQALTTVSDTGVYLDTTAGKLTATSFSGNGAALTNLNASNIASGTIAAARLPLVTTTTLGAMSAADKINLDNLVSKTLVEGNGTVTNVVSLTQAEYDALSSKSATTLYVVTD